MNIVGINNMSKEGERRRYLPLEIRLQMYDDVVELRKQRLSYTQILEKVHEKYKKLLPLSTISYWVKGNSHPLEKVNNFNNKPSQKLTYIIGAILSDGERYSKNGQHRLRLAVKDYEFAEEFGKCLAKVLGRKEPYKPFWSEYKKQWVVEAYSILLYEFLNKPLEELKPYIEYSKKTVSAFLRALFDGEGSIYKRVLTFSNSNKKLLNYIKFLLKRYFNIDTSKYLIAKRKHSPNGVYKNTKNLYCLYIHANSLSNFYKYIGFTIKRKQKRLIKAIKQ